MVTDPRNFRQLAGETSRLSRRDETEELASAGALSVTDRTYQLIFDMILSRELPPGHVLQERRLARTLNVSRTPLRAALSRLHGERMLNRLSNGIVVVREFSASDFLELVHVRRLLESEAAALAAGRVAPLRLRELRDRLIALMEHGGPTKGVQWNLDDDLHDTIAQASGNRSLAALICDIRRRVRMCNVERNPGRLLPACREHIAIVDALAAGDARKARSAMELHLDNVREAFVQSLAPRAGRR